MLAVSLLYGVTQNHPFIQGNKRTGFTGALVFMELNGYPWVGEDDPDHWATLIVQVQQQVVPESYLADAMRLFVVSAG